MAASPSAAGRRPTPWWDRARHADRRPFLLQRQRLTAAVRDFFLARGFVEAETACLQVSPGLEPHLSAFETRLEQPDGSASTLYLHTSPEFACKKLLAAGEERLFTLARVWRNGERSATHHPEFTLLEWYRAGADYRALMEDCEGLLRHVARALGIERYRWQGESVDPSRPFERVTVPDAVQRWAGIDLLATAPDPLAPDPLASDPLAPDPLAPDADALRAAVRAAGIRCAEDDSWDDLVTRILLEKVEPQLGKGRASFLADYPVSLAALSRPKPEDPRLAERFELYVAGLELANAFSELTDPAEQRRRFQVDMALKQRLYGRRYPIDEDFLAALAAMPPAAGIALGIDRLAMLATGATHIEQVLWTPVAERGT